MSKIDSWPQTIVLVVGIVTAGAVFVFLVAAGWKEGSIAAMVTLAVGQFIGLLAATRKTSVVEAKTDVQSEQLTQIVKQTNGRSEAEQQEIAERAVTAVLERRGL